MEEAICRKIEDSVKSIVKSKKLSKDVADELLNKNSKDIDKPNRLVREINSADNSIKRLNRLYKDLNC